MRTLTIAALLAAAGAAHAQPFPVGYPADFAGIFTLEFTYWNQLEKGLPIVPIPDQPYDPENPWPPNCIYCGQNSFLQDDATLIGAKAGTPVLLGFGDLPLMASQIANYPFRATQGPLIQVPWFGYPVAIPVRNAAATQNGAAVLNDNDLCGVFSGRLTDWNQTSAGQAGKLAPGPITVVYRQDSTSAAQILTAHFAKVCTPNNANFAFPIMPTPVLWGAFPVGGGLPPNFLAANSAGQEQSLLLQQSSAIGYLAPGYTSVAPKARNTSPLVVAALVNSAGVPVLPDTADTAAALAAPSGNAINRKPPTGSAAADPTRWIPADPTPLKGYPLAGYETADFSTCYTQAPASRIATYAVWSWIELLLYRWGLTTPAVIQYLGQEGLVESPAIWTHAAQATFLKANAQNLNIQNPAVCTGLAGR